jgi:hypothetical protein
MALRIRHAPFCVIAAAGEPALTLAVRFFAPRLSIGVPAVRLICGAMFRRVSSPVPVGFIEPCLPTNARAVPAGTQWAYEIKRDSFRFSNAA